MRALTTVLWCTLIATLTLTAMAGDPEWSAKSVYTLDNLNVPECILFHPANGSAYVSNIESAPEEWWTDDGKGYISRLDAAGMVTARRWVSSSAEQVLNSPKGMCLLDGRLYFTDNSRLMSCDAETGAAVRVVSEGFEQANDLATDGKAVWLSDTKASRIYCVLPDGSRREVPSPDTVNGLAFHQGRLYAVSWAQHDVYEIDPDGKAAPRPFGVAGHFKNLDGIEVLDDGTFVVSDFMGNQVCAIGPDRKTVWRLIEIASPADIGLDRSRGLLGVPQFLEDKLVVFKLEKR